MYRQYQTNPWQQVLTHLQTSMYALELQCSFATQMKLMDETKKLPGLSTLHKENYETSYHRTTALGCLHRIIGGDTHPYVVGIMIQCMHQALRHDMNQRAAIQRMASSATGVASSWVNVVNHWQSIQLQELQRAMNLTRQMVGEQMWQYAMKLEY